MKRPHLIPPLRLPHAGRTLAPRHDIARALEMLVVHHDVPSLWKQVQEDQNTTRG